MNLFKKAKKAEPPRTVGGFCHTPGLYESIAQCYISGSISAEVAGGTIIRNYDAMAKRRRAPSAVDFLDYLYHMREDDTLKNYVAELCMTNTQPGELGYWGLRHIASRILKPFPPWMTPKEVYMPIWERMVFDINEEAHKRLVLDPRAELKRPRERRDDWSKISTQAFYSALGGLFIFANCVTIGGVNKTSFYAASGFTLLLQMFTLDFIPVGIDRSFRKLECDAEEKVSRDYLMFLKYNYPLD